MPKGLAALGRDLESRVGRLSWAPGPSAYLSFVHVHAIPKRKRTWHWSEMGLGLANSHSEHGGVVSGS